MAKKLNNFKNVDLPFPSSPISTALSPGFNTQEKSRTRHLKSFRWVIVKFFTCIILASLISLIVKNLFVKNPFVKKLFA